jgi:hypothetical protein
VAELADASDLGSGAARRGSSSLPPRTNNKINRLALSLLTGLLFMGRIFIVQIIATPGSFCLRFLVSFGNRVFFTTGEQTMKKQWQGIQIEAEGTGISEPLSIQVNLLGELLGAVIREYAGQEIFELVEITPRVGDMKLRRS